MSCTHCVCVTCANLLNYKKCHICPKTIEVKVHAIEDDAPLFIGGGGAIHVDTPADAHHVMESELVKYHKIFENPLTDTFVSLSN